MLVLADVVSYTGPWSEKGHPVPSYKVHTHDPSCLTEHYIFIIRRHHLNLDAFFIFLFLVRHFELLHCAFDTDSVAANRQAVSDVDVREAFYCWFYCRTC